MEKRYFFALRMGCICEKIHLFLFILGRVDVKNSLLSQLADAKNP